MPKFYDSIPDDLRDWALSQQVFFTASAPLTGRHINVSPKGLPASTFTIFDPNHAAYIDATGSGIETVSHVYENGRVTIMFCSFGKLPRIMRFFCKGVVVEWNQSEFEPLLKKMGNSRVEGARAVILLDIFKVDLGAYHRLDFGLTIEQVQTSCGYGVPFLTSEPSSESNEDPAKLALKDRETLGHWASNKIEKNELRNYQAEWNSHSLDGLPGLRVARQDSGERLWFINTKARALKIAGQWEALVVGTILGSILVIIPLLLT